MGSILCLIGGLLIGGGIIALFLYPKIKTNTQLDLEVQKKNEQIRKDNEILSAKYKSLSDDLVELNGRKNEISASIISMNQQAKDTEKTIYESAQRAAAANFELSATKMAEEYGQAQIQYKMEYETLLDDLVKEYVKRMTEYNTEFDDIQIRINNAKANLDDQIRITQAAIEANKRESASKEQKNFYKIQITDIDLEDIKKLRSIAPSLRNREPLDKVIWKSYYEKPTAALIGRVIGADIKCGIYKITNLENGMCYIGQSVKVNVGR